MTINKKSSRRIIVGNELYRWTISPHSGYVVLIIEHEIVIGSRMEVFIQTDINDLWVNFPYIDELNLRVIKPKDVNQIITQAILEGWKPKERGKPIIFDLIEERIKRRI